MRGNDDDDDGTKRDDGTKNRDDIGESLGGMDGLSTWTHRGLSINSLLLYSTCASAKQTNCSE